MNKTEDWKKQIAKEMEKTSSILNDLGFSLEESQIHVLGERYLIGGKKLVLLGRNKKTNDKVIIKVSSHPSGIKEIRKERASKNILEEIKFAYHVFNFPKEILFTQKNGYLILVTSFIEQDKKFLEHSLREQFFLALKIFEIQEGVHATTSEHSKTIKKYFGQMNAKDYIKSFKNNQKNILLKIKDSKIKRLLSEAQNKLEKNADTINLYSNFLTHWDMVPHNIRIKNGDVYLLDTSSFRFGNKHEGWARFLNFMTLYNRPLENALVSYLQKNRTKEERQSLWLMRIYRLGEIIWYYTKLLDKTSDNIKLLTEARIDFWTKVLEATLAQKQVSKEEVNNYIKIRNSLRSEEEKIRQQKLH